MMNLVQLKTAYMGRVQFTPNKREAFRNWDHFKHLVPELRMDAIRAMLGTIPAKDAAQVGTHTAVRLRSKIGANIFGWDLLAEIVWEEIQAYGTANQFKKG